MPPAVAFRADHAALIGAVVIAAFFALFLSSANLRRQQQRQAPDRPSIADVLRPGPLPPYPPPRYAEAPAAFAQTAADDDALGAPVDFQTSPPIVLAAEHLSPEPFLQVGTLAEQPPTTPLPASARPRVLPLMGRPTRPGSPLWNYYTRDAADVTFPIRVDGADCERAPCRPLRSSDTIRIPELGPDAGEFIVTLRDDPFVAA